jgi:hypothetical protein
VNIEHLRVKRSDLKEVVLPRLRGRVFHVTTPSAFEGIRTDEQVHSNVDERHAFTYPQSKNNWGRNQGYVCLFDLRDVSEENLKDALMKFYFLKPSRADPVFLFLNPAEYGRLIPWTAAPVISMRVPHVECWYPTDLQIEKVTESLVITLEPDDADSLMRAALRKARDPELWSGGATLQAPTLKDLARRVKEVAVVATSNGFTITEGWDRKRVWKEGANYGIDIRLERPEHLR